MRHFIATVCLLVNVFMSCLVGIISIEAYPNTWLFIGIPLLFSIVGYTWLYTQIMFHTKSRFYEKKVSEVYWKHIFENLVGRIETITKQMKESGGNSAEFAFDIEAEIEGLSEGDGAGEKR